MQNGQNNSIQNDLDQLFRAESPYILASLIRILGDLHTAEDAMQEAFSIAAEKWPDEGIPNNPRSWLISTARFKAIDKIRRDSKSTNLIETEALVAPDSADLDRVIQEQIEDDLLRLIFICCHPVLPTEAQVTLTLREVCGLKTDEIARAFLVSETTMAQRITRAKAKLRNAGAILESPVKSEVIERLASVLRVIYLVFNEGYYASSGDSLTSADLSQEAIRLGKLLAHFMPHPEVFGLNALMCLSESRRIAREHDGDIILLEDQDRSLWNQELITAGNSFLQQSQSLGPAGGYTIQAQIAAKHANAPASNATDWIQIIKLYDDLDYLMPSPIIKLNRAVAIAMSGQIDLGLQQVTDLINSDELNNYGLAHAARGDLLRRQGNIAESFTAYTKALHLSQMAPEKRFLQKRINELQSNS